MRALIWMAVLMAGCRHGAEAAGAFVTLVEAAQAPAAIARDVSTIDECIRRPYGICHEMARGGAADDRSRGCVRTPYLRGTVALSGPFGLQPVAFTEVRLEHEGLTLSSAATDGRGVFSFYCGVPAGMYDVVVRDGGYRGATRLFLEEPRRDLLVVAARP